MNIPFLLKPKSEVACILDTKTVRQGLETMRAHGYTAIPVLTKEGYYVGSISEGDFLWCIVNNEKYTPKSQEELFVSDILKHNRSTPAVKINAPMEELLVQITDHNFVPVTDDRGYFVGIVTRRDIIQYLCKEHKE